MRVRDTTGEPLGQGNTRATLTRLLDQLVDPPAHAERFDHIATEIEHIFGETRAVLVLDMSGFSRTTRHHGIVTFLSMIHHMRRIVSPLIAAAGGIVVKAEADNLHCLLDTPAIAIAAARSIIDSLDAANRRLPEARRIHVSIGIGYGAILNIGGEDMFGDEVNLACKLGEDVAGRGEILLTPAAYAALSGTTPDTRITGATIAGLILDYHLLL